MVPGLGEEVADEPLVGVREVDLDTSEALAPVELESIFLPGCAPRPGSAAQVSRNRPSTSMFGHLSDGVGNMRLRWS